MGPPSSAFSQQSRQNNNNQGALNDLHVLMKSIEEQEQKSQQLSIEFAKFTRGIRDLTDGMSTYITENEKKVTKLKSDLAMVTLRYTNHMPPVYTSTQQPQTTTSFSHSPPSSLSPPFVFTQPPPQQPAPTSIQPPQPRPEHVQKLTGKHPAPSGAFAFPASKRQRQGSRSSPPPPPPSRSHESDTDDDDDDFAEDGVDDSNSNEKHSPNGNNTEYKSFMNENMHESVHGGKPLLRSGVSRSLSSTFKVFSSALRPYILTLYWVRCFKPPGSTQKIKSCGGLLDAVDKLVTKQVSPAIDWYRAHPSIAKYQKLNRRERIKKYLASGYKWLRLLAVNAHYSAIQRCQTDSYTMEVERAKIRDISEPLAEVICDFKYGVRSTESPPNNWIFDLDECIDIVKGKIIVIVNYPSTPHQ